MFSLVCKDLFVFDVVFELPHGYVSNLDTSGEKERERYIYIIIVIICNLYTVCTYTRLFKTCLMVLCIIAMFFNT